MQSNLIDIACEIKAETEKAVLISDGTVEVWLPKSQVEIDEAAGEVTMPEWLASAKGLI